LPARPVTPVSRRASRWHQGHRSHAGRAIWHPLPGHLNHRGQPVPPGHAALSSDSGPAGPTNALAAFLNQSGAGRDGQAPLARALRRMLRVWARRRHDRAGGQSSLPECLVRYPPVRPFTRRFVRAAVKPECPGLYRAIRSSPAAAQGSAARRAGISFSSAASTACTVCSPSPTGSAENDKAIIDEPIHECRVPGPALLVPELTRGVPAWTVNQSHREIGHDRSVGAIAKQPCGRGTADWARWLAVAALETGR
jgi:hypothetical protein